MQHFYDACMIYYTLMLTFTIKIKKKVIQLLVCT